MPDFDICLVIALPSSTPGWSKALIFNSRLSNNTRFSYVAMSDPSAAGVCECKYSSIEGLFPLK